MKASDQVKASWHPRAGSHRKEDMDQKAEYCHAALVLLPNVTFLQVRYYTRQHEWNLLSQLIPQMSSLRILDLHGMDKQIDELPFSTATSIHAELTEKSVLALAKPSVAHKVRTFVTNYHFEMVSRAEPDVHVLASNNFT